MDKIAVLIPCYNEEQTIQKVIRDAKRALPEAVVYVYNNNSTDKSALLAKEAGAIVRNEYKQGKGNVIRRMFREIDALVYIMVDGDDTYPMDSAPEMVDLVLNHNADMVVGDRLSSTYYSENKRPFHNLGNSLVKSSINHLFGCNIRDIMTGFRAFSYEFVKSFPVLSRGFEIETEMTIHAVYNNLQIDNVVIDYRDRPEGSVSKLNTFQDGFKVIMTIIRFYRNYKPLGFFTFISVFLFLISILFLIPILSEYWITHMVPRFPTLIVCCFIMLAAVISFFSGLLLSNLALGDRRDFEMRLNMLHRHKEEMRI